jgi:hypothetical protein
MSSFNAVSAYFSQKRVTGSQLLNFSVYGFISILLIYGGVLILQSENIFKKVYEGFDVPTGTGTGTGTETETESRTGTLSLTCSACSSRQHRRGRRVTMSS